MPTGATGQLGLALPVQGELSGTWGNTVNNAITEYTNIAIAATLTLTNDGAVTLANTTGTDLATNITSTLTGAGTVTAQFAIVRVTGTLTTAKVVTAPSYSKTYTVVNAATGGIVTFKASGQTGVSIAVGESAFVYFNGTDYVKVSGTSAVSSFTAGTTGFTPSTATTGAVTLAGTLGTANGGTGQTSFTSGGVVYASSSSALATGSALTFDGTSLSTTGQILLNNNNYVGFKNTSGTAAVSIFNDTSNFLNLYNSGNTGTIFYTNAAEQMRLTSTGLGIGTSSPTGRLDLSSTYVSDTTVQARIRDNTGWALNFTGTASGFKALQVQDSSGGASYTSLLLQPLGGNVGIATSSPISTQGGLDISSGGLSLVIGADNGSSTRTNANNKSGRFAMAHYTNAEEPFAIALCDVTSTTNELSLGGGSGACNTATVVKFFTAANNTTVSGSERMRITSAGDVGIGTSSPNAKLSFGNASYASTDIPDIIRLYDTGTASSSFGFGLNGAKESIGQLGIYGGDASTIGFFTGGLLERARINQAGGFSVGTTAASGAGAILATGNITAYYSDARLKTVSGKIENALDKVGKLSGVYYTNNDTAKSFGYDSDEIQVGVIAQEVEAVLPQIVKAAPFDLDENNNSKSGENYKTVQYDKLVPLLIEAINELRAEVRALKGE